MHPLGPLEEATAYQIYRLARLMRQNLQKALKAGGLDVTAEQYFLLYRFAAKGWGCTIRISGPSAERSSQSYTTY